MISTGLLVLLLLVAVVTCLILAWHTRRWPDPHGGRSRFGRLSGKQLRDVVTRQVSAPEADL